MHVYHVSLGGDNTRIIIRYSGARLSRDREAAAQVQRFARLLWMGTGLCLKWIEILWRANFVLRICTEISDVDRSNVLSLALRTAGFPSR